ncbi:glycoside hydrolase family 99-like domain-containing protein [Maribellus sp. YY47]|uniref:glycosyltransferase WbsX family protein n=1 Tax=Maribellus sp. YY47 TaxID=2929486 RepID=UPI0020013134|nr:glycoside hydrolase family 99-like domain-containing protein [Maribellus sp. YY47]MCK3683707.1 glycoside hydrolase family 99-like domain-containing protein [Maribellus sp. YY47]
MKRTRLNPKYFLFALIFLSSALLINCSQPEKPANVTAENNDYYVAAYIWPSCHHDERFGDMLWPEGTGEWEVIKKGNPRFEGHYQPRQPLWGYELDNDPRVMEKWIDAATSHGVNIFVFDWYWFDGGPFLESALNDGFLKAKNNSDMQFYIMWANHDVKRNYWNVHKFKDDTSLLWDGAVDWDNFKIIVDRVIKQYFNQPNYFKIDGKPVFSIFSIGNLLEGFGGSVEEARKALDYFREEVKKAGFPGLHIQWNQGGGSIMSKEAADQFSENVTKMGFNSVAMYNMGGMKEDYLAYGANSVKIRTQMDSILNVPLFPCVSIGWDDTPRFPAKGINDVVHYHNTPESFAALLSKAKKYADSHPEQPRLITINAWNEWVEGSYLLPDMLNGYGYLNAVKKVMNGEFDECK